MIACENSGHEPTNDFPEVRKIVEAGATTKPKKDYEIKKVDEIKKENPEDDGDMDFLLMQSFLHYKNEKDNVYLKVEGEINGDDMDE